MNVFLHKVHTSLGVFFVQSRDRDKLFPLTCGGGGGGGGERGAVWGNVNVTLYMHLLRLSSKVSS